MVGKLLYAKSTIGNNNVNINGNLFVATKPQVAVFGGVITIYVIRLKIKMSFVRLLKLVLLLLSNVITL